jgi:hypothetical protein
MAKNIGKVFTTKIWTIFDLKHRGFPWFYKYLNFPRAAHCHRFTVDKFASITKVFHITTQGLAVDYSEITGTRGQKETN